MIFLNEIPLANKTTIQFNAIRDPRYIKYGSTQQGRYLCCAIRLINAYALQY